MGCQEQILHDLTEYEANKVISRLSENDISPSKVLQADGRWAVSVSSQKVVKALAVIDTSRVLAGRLNTPTASSKSGLIPNRHEQWYLYVQSIAQSVEQSLHAIPGVLEARVHLNMPETDPLIGRSRDQVGSGSVLLLINRDFQAKDEEIAALVSGAAGMPSNTIRVLRSISPDAREKGTEKAVVVAKSESSPVLSGVTTAEIESQVASQEKASKAAIPSKEMSKQSSSQGSISDSSFLSVKVVTAAGGSLLLLVCIAGGVLLVMRRRSSGAQFPIERGEV
jgi:type III secretory pathway lipoprotein EscJ